MNRWLDFLASLRRSTLQRGETDEEGGAQAGGSAAPYLPARNLKERRETDTRGLGVVSALP